MYSRENFLLANYFMNQNKDLAITLPTNEVRTGPIEPETNARRPFLTPLPDLPGEFLLVIDNTSLDKIKRCHKAAQNYLVLGREAQAKTTALVFGGAFHEAASLFHQHEYWYQLGDKSSGLGEKLGVDTQNRAIRQHFLDHPLPPFIYSSDYRTEAAALELFRHYRNQCNTLVHPDYEWEILADDKGPIIERAFEIPLAVLEFENFKLDLAPYGTYDSRVVEVKKIHLAWSGRIDLLARVNSRNHVVDHKTSSIFTPDYFRQFELSSQVRGYVWAASHLWPEHSPKSFIHNGIFFQKPGVNQGLTTPGPRGGKAPLHFQRTFYPTNNEQAFSDAAISRWERDTILTIEDFLHSVSRSVFPLNDSACIQKFGLCEYHDCCRMDDEDMGNRYLMSPAFREVTWNPTK